MAPHQEAAEDIWPKKKHGVDIAVENLIEVQSLLDTLTIKSHHHCPRPPSAPTRWNLVCGLENFTSPQPMGEILILGEERC